MKIIHCADLHLDSKMNSNLDQRHAKERNGELLHTFERMISYAADNDVSAILISGDLFDRKHISLTVRNTVFHNIKEHSNINFYYLKGNHDQDNFFVGMKEIPANLRMFNNQWTYYKEAKGKIIISGVELNDENNYDIYASWMSELDRFNIVMLHGQENERSVRDRSDIIDLKLLRNKGIDYLALGHVHYYKKERLDDRGVYCYPGCLEGRGFDECGEHGFVLLDINEKNGKYTHTFVPFAFRKIYEVKVDVTGCNTTSQIIGRTAGRLSEEGCEKSSLVKITLTGTVDVECEKDIDFLSASFKREYYLVKVYDETSLYVNYEDYMMDESLKGEFVRQVMNTDKISEEEKRTYIRYGLQALAGEDIE